MARIYGIDENGRGMKPGRVVAFVLGAGNPISTEMGDDWVSKRAFLDIITRHPSGITWRMEEQMRGFFVGHETGFIGYTFTDEGGRKATQLLYTDDIAGLVESNPDLSFVIVGVFR